MGISSPPPAGKWLGRTRLSRFATLCGNEDEGTSLDEIEQALARAFADPGQRDAFYRTLLERQVFFLTPESVRESRGVTERETSVAVVQLQSPDGRIIPIFSSAEKAQAFAEGRANLFGVQGAAATRILADLGVPAVLNPNSPQSKLLAVEEIRSLLPMLGQETAVPAGTEFTIGQPAERPTRLLEALGEVFAGYPNVADASLALIHMAGSEQPPHFLIGVRGTDLQPAFTAAGLAARRACGIELLDFAALEGGDDGLTEYFRGVEPFYRRR